jgi:hypothetical protein
MRPSWRSWASICVFFALALLALTACAAPSHAPLSATADVEGTVTARVAATQLARPVPTPTRGVDDLTAELDRAWAASDWATVLALLDTIEKQAPDAVDVADKRYAAHVFRGQQYERRGDLAAAGN